MARQIFKVQKLAAFKSRDESGRKQGRVWITIATKGRIAVAERVAAGARIDNPDAQIRIEKRARQ